ncbi:ferritin-like domain-containing protein [Anatilimnocola floriformis]|uniref:ferritin-like domain-containing protein n=1 Tax=Anatilimnocola floriformis TaxID=2948575 RepID=UPI0020C33FD5|nr:ferritin-like domain-containing protein [Anatilimnocola floriformis]
MDTLLELLEDQIKDLYSAENQLTKALPKLAKKAASESLADAFTSHLKETNGQIERLQKVGELLKIKLTGKKCKAMEGLIEEGKEVLEEEGKSAVIDSALIGAAQRVEHYEIAAYGTAKAMAEHLGFAKVVKLLEQTLAEESECDEKLSSISLDEILPATDVTEEDSAVEEVDPPKPTRKKASARK